MDPAILSAAHAATGITDVPELVNGALALLAARDDFGAWLLAQSQQLPEDFEPAV